MWPWEGCNGFEAAGADHFRYATTSGRYCIRSITAVEDEELVGGGLKENIFAPVPTELTVVFIVLTAPAWDASVPHREHWKK